MNKEYIKQTIYIIFIAIACVIAWWTGVEIRIQKYYYDKNKDVSEIEICTIATEEYTTTTTEELTDDSEIVDCLITEMPVSYIKEESYEDNN